ncbi:MAG: anaerobic ribonucleoside-triphosphate reductase activating protein [Spirochaetaceae bacterium]
MLNVSGFYDNSCTNGDGWRSVIFLSGCPHKCIGCHNPETWSTGSGDDYSVDQLTHMVLNNKTFIEGITLSGGEPFQEQNIAELLMFVHNIKSEGLSIWCYTGYLYEDLLKNPLYSILLEQIDVLIDGPYIDDLFEPSLKFRGSSNQRIIDVKSSFLDKKLTLYYDNEKETAS